MQRRPDKQFLVGLDLGQTQDPSALIVSDLYKMPIPVTENTYGKEVLDFASHNKERQLRARHSKRWELGTNYMDVIYDVKEIVERGEIKDSCTLIVDQTGVGRAVIDIMRSIGMKPVAVTFHSGHNMSQDGADYSVPKRDIVWDLLVMIEQGMAIISGQLPDIDQLKKELARFRMKINKSTAKDSYEAWSQSDHDDLLIAFALCAWYARKFCRYDQNASHTKDHALGASGGAGEAAGKVSTAMPGSWYSP